MPLLPVCRYLTGLMAPFNEKAEDLMQRLSEKADGKTEVGMLNMFCRVTLDVISKVLRKNRFRFSVTNNIAQILANGFFQSEQPIPGL